MLILIRGEVREPHPPPAPAGDPFLHSACKARGVFATGRYLTPSEGLHVQQLSMQQQNTIKSEMRVPQDCAQKVHTKLCCSMLVNREAHVHARVLQIMCICSSIYELS